MEESHDKDSKSEEPTEKKIRDAVERGQIPVSREVSTLFGLLGFSAFFLFFGQSAIMSSAVSLSSVIDMSDRLRLDTGHDVLGLVRLLIAGIGGAFLPLFVILVVVGLAASFLQNQPAAILERIVPKANRISPSAGFKRIFGAAGMAEFLKSLAKLSVAATVVAFSMKSVPQTLLEGMFQQTPVFGQALWTVTVKLMLSVSVAMLVIAGADLVWSRFHWRTGLRMTRQEVKDEMKQAEGDPIVKARIRSVARDRARRRMMKAVETATLVIANPTHYAVALRYERPKDAAPVVVAKGQDLVALKIREIAEEHGVQVFEDVALARSLHKAVAVDRTIPPEFFAAVAELVRIVYASKPVRKM